MITFKDIYELLRKEKYAEQLQPLPKLFLKDFAQYIKEKKEISSKDSEIFSDAISKTKKQLENAMTLIRELMLRRKKKILNLAFIAAETGISKKDFENMLDYEKEFFDAVIKELEGMEKKFSSFINGIEEKQLKNQLVRFKVDVENFLDEAGNEIGPFNKGDLANLSKEICKILVEDNKAAPVDEEFDEKED